MNCPTHGAFVSRDGACPTCRDLEAARDLLSRAPHGRTARHRRARELLADLGERVDDGVPGADRFTAPGYHDPGGESVSFDLGGSA